MRLVPSSRARLDAANGVIEVVAEASDGLGGVEKAARFHPTVILMDIRVPVGDGRSDLTQI